MASKKKSSKKAPKKPILEHQNEPAYNWNDVWKWIEYRTGKNVRDWAAKFGGRRSDYTREKTPYQDMWHWICDTHEIHNGCYFYLSLDDEQIDDDDAEHLFIREIFAVLREEFPEAQGEMYCYTYW
jgi:hypothetical protein